MHCEVVGVFGIHFDINHLVIERVEGIELLKYIKAAKELSGFDFEQSDVNPNRYQAGELIAVTMARSKAVQHNLEFLDSALIVPLGSTYFCHDLCVLCRFFDTGVEDQGLTGVRRGLVVFIKLGCGRSSNN